MKRLFVVMVLIATLVSQGTAQLPFGPVFHLSQYQATEGETLVVRLSAPFLTRPQVPPFNGRIEVDITAEDLPSGDSRQNAEFGADYLVNSQNSSSRTFTVVFLSKQANSTENGILLAADDIVEGNEAFRLRIVAARFIGQAATIFRAQDGLTNTIADVTIEDDDSITVEFEQDMYMVDESDGMVDVTVIASGRTSFEYTFTVTPMDLTATNNFDYTYPTTTYSFFPTDENEPIPSLVISIPIINDGDNERDENFKLTLNVSAEGEAANVTEGPSSMTVVLIKDDDDVTVTFSPQNYTVTEGDPAPLMIILDKPAAKDITVAVTTMDITTTDTDDYIGGSFDLSIPAGSVKVTLNVNTLQDSIVELPEYFKATLSLPGAPEGCVVGTPDMSYITIIDDSPMIPVQFNPANYSVKEGVDGNAVIVLEALNNHNFDFTVIVNFRNGTAIDGSDYTGGPFEVTFPAGVNTVSFNVPILDDAIAECAKLFNLDLDIPVAAAGMGVIRGSPDTATVHIMDDDVEELRLSIENADYMVKENVVSFVAAVVASGPAEFEYTVTVETSDDTAVGGDDFVSQQYQLTFPAGQTRAEFTVAITDDNVIEAMESFQLLLSIPQDLISKGVQIGPSSAATVTISDNDVQVKFSQSSVAITEEEGRVLVTVEAMGDLSSDFSIIVMAINGSAVEPFDFTGNMWPVDFIANQASASFEISIAQDNLPEIPEEFSLKIAIESPYDERVTVGEPSRLTAGITVEDLHLSIEVAHYMVKENVGSFVAAVVASRAADFNYTVTVETSDGTAVGGDNFVSQQYQLDFPAGQTRAEFTVVITDDSVIEAMESFELLLSIPEAFISKGVQVGPNSAATVTISDNDDSTIIQLHLRPVSDCLTWVETNGEAKLADVSAALSVPLQQQCSCSLSVQQSFFSCFGTMDSQTVVFLAELSYTALPGVDIPSLLTSWVTSTPHIVVASIQMQVDTTCPVVIDSLEPESCLAASVAPPINPPADPSTEVTVIVAVVVVVFLVVMTATVAIAIAVTVFCRKQSKYRPNHPLPNSVYEYMDKESMALGNMMSNPSYMTAKHVVSTSFAPGTEENKEIDHTNEVLPFEATEEGQDDTIQGGSHEATADDDRPVYINQ